MTETLDKNHFYRSLVTLFRDHYVSASDNCYLVCVPVNRSVNSHNVNEAMVQSHILRPSPLLMSHYIPIKSKNVSDVAVEDMNLLITKGDGRTKQVVRILGEEIAYNNRNQKYRILLIEKPLTDFSKSGRADEISDECLDLPVTFVCCQDFLNHISTTLTEEIEKKSNKLLETYMILPNYLSDAADRLKVVIDWSIEKFRTESFLHNRNDENLESIVESFILGTVHHRVYEAVLKKYSTEDQRICEKAQALDNANVSITDFGAHSIFQIFTITPNIMKQFSSLGDKINALEKLECLKKTLNMLNDEMKNCIVNASPPFGSANDTPCITSDDLIASVICLIVASQPKNMSSDINYIQNFSWFLPNKNEYGFALVTFEVAKEFVKNLNESSLIASKLAKQGSSEDSPNPIRRVPSRIEAEFDEVSEIIESNGPLFSFNQAGNPIATTHDDDLGDFLGSLRLNYCIVASGKQN